MRFRLVNFLLLLLIFFFPKCGYSLVGSERVGKGWEAIVYIEFHFKQSSRTTSCTGFLINSSQAITVGHCAIHDESKALARSAAICIGKQRPFSNPGEGCFQSKEIRLANKYQYNSPSDMAIIDLLEDIPLNFLGIKPLQLISGKQLDSLIDSHSKNSNKMKIISFGSRNFNAPTLGKKGWVNAVTLKWDEVSGLLEATAKGTVYGLSDDGAGLLLKTTSGWKLVGLMTRANPDFFISVQPFFDPCLPPEPSPRQPDIKLTSSFKFVSVNSIACNNNFFTKNIRSKKSCGMKPLSTQQMMKKAKINDANGLLAMELYLRSNLSRDKLNWLNKASAKGNEAAMLKLADEYMTGENLRKNHKKSLELITQSALKGYAEAEYRVSLLLRSSDAMKPVVKGGWLEWVHKAARQGYAAAQFQYAQQLANNQQKDVYDWLMRSARQGFADAQFQLGYNYYHGHNVKKDRYIGIQWLEYAAGQGHIKASDFLKRHPGQEIPDY